MQQDSESVRLPTLASDGFDGDADLRVLRQMSAGPYMPQDFDVDSENESSMLDGSGAGACIIINQLQGQYYVCGTACDSHRVIDFIGRFERGELTPRDICMHADDHHQATPTVVQFRDKRYSRALTGTPRSLLGAPPSRMPGIVIWLPNRQHSHTEDRMNPDALFRAILRYAVEVCPTDNDMVQMGIYNDLQALAEGRRSPLIDMSDRLTLLKDICKCWIFAAKLPHQRGSLRQRKVEDDPEHANAYAGERFVGDLQSYLLKVFESPARRRSTQLSDHEDSLELEQPFADDLYDDEEADVSEGLASLRKPYHNSVHVQDMRSTVMYTAAEVQTLYQAMIDELSYHALVVRAPPPMFVLFVGDLPGPAQVPWPEFMKNVHVHVVGSKTNLKYLRSVCPTARHTTFEKWIARPETDDFICPNSTRKWLRVEYL